MKPLNQWAWNNYLCRLKEAQLSVRRITGEKKVETRKINPNSLVGHDSLQEILLRLFSLCDKKHASKNKLHYLLPTERATASERSQLVFTILTRLNIFPNQLLFDKHNIQPFTIFYCFFSSCLLHVYGVLTHRQTALIYCIKRYWTFED